MKHRTLMLYALLPVLAVATTALAGGVGFSPFPDCVEYLRLGEALYRTGTFEYGNIPAGWRTPGYPMFPALFGWAGAWGFLAVNLVFVFGIAYLTLRFAEEFKFRRLWIPVLLLTLNAGFLAVGSVPLSETAFLFWLLLGCRLTYGNRLYTGALAFSMATLTRPIGLLFALPLAVYLVWTRVKVRKIIPVLLLTLLLPGLWSIRNFHRYGALRYTSIAGFNLLLYKAGGYLATQTDTPMVEQHRQLLTRLSVSVDDDPFEAGRQAGVLGRRIIRENALPFSFWCLRNVPYILMPDLTPLLERLGLARGNLGTYDILVRKGPVAALRFYLSKNPYAAILGAIYLPFYLATLGLAATGAVLLIRRRNTKALLAVLLLSGYFTLLPVGNLDWRFRLPLLPMIVLLADYAVSEWRRRPAEPAAPPVRAESGEGPDAPIS